MLLVPSRVRHETKIARHDEWRPYILTGWAGMHSSGGFSDVFVSSMNIHLAEQSDRLVTGKPLWTFSCTHVWVGVCNYLVEQRLQGERFGLLSLLCRFFSTHQRATHHRVLLRNKSTTKPSYMYSSIISDEIRQR